MGKVNLPNAYKKILLFLKTNVSYWDDIETTASETNYKKGYSLVVNRNYKLKAIY